MNIQRLEGDLTLRTRQLEVAEETVKGEKAEVMRLYESLQEQEKQVGDTRASRRGGEVSKDLETVPTLMPR